MVPSIKERKENSRVFGLCYEDICKMQRRMPVPFVKTHLKKGALDFSADRITYEEWGPILNALSMDTSLHFIAIRSMQSSKTALEYITAESQAKVLERIPVIQSRYLLMLLVNSVKCCMSVSHALTCIELEGLPLGPEYLKHILEGIPKCKTLQTISFYRSPIGDEGCEELCHVIKYQVNIFAVDLSACNLTERGVRAIAELIKFQKIHRCSETWKQTLRYRVPNLESLPGIRRIILNDNTDIGDLGLLHLVNVLKDDLFLKALDLQNCSLSNVGGSSVLEMLKCNTTLAIVDIRANKQLSPDLLDKVMKKLALNNEGCAEEHQWIDIKKFCASKEPRPLSQQNINRSRSHSCQRIASAGSERTAATSLLSSHRSKSIFLDKGIPWRISVRLTQRQENATLNPGTPRSIQLQEERPPYQIIPTAGAAEYKSQLLKMKNHITWLEEQLELEIKRREEVEKEKEDLRKVFDRCSNELNAEKLSKQGKVLIDLETMQLLEKMLNEVTDVIESPIDKGQKLPIRPENLINEEKKLHSNEQENLLLLMRKSQSEHTKRKQTLKLEKLSTSAYVLKKEPVNRETVMQLSCIERNVGDTTINCQENCKHLSESCEKDKILDKQSDKHAGNISEKNWTDTGDKDLRGLIIQNSDIEMVSNRMPDDKQNQNGNAVPNSNSLYHIVLMKNKQLNEETNLHLRPRVNKHFGTLGINPETDGIHSKSYRQKHSSHWHTISKQISKCGMEGNNASSEQSSDAKPNCYIVSTSATSTGEDRNLTCSQDLWSTLPHLTSSEKSYETESDTEV